jgi:cation diffusion facilitator CzcD-associated flavoprotein CzcO
LIVGAGQSGLAIAFGRKLQQVNNIRIVDRSSRGLEGPWRRFARMTELRTPKEVTGIDLGIASLTLRAWYEARFGRRQWQRLDTIPPQLWQQYLAWYRKTLKIPVENDIELTSITPAGDLLCAVLRHANRVERVYARKIVLATGIEGSGRWRVPGSLLGDLSSKFYCHTADDIDFSQLAGKRIGVLGVGASALDNAAAALEAGAARVDVCFRRADIPRVNPLAWTNFAGMLGHFGDLDDLQRWRFMRHILDVPMPPPQHSFWRCRRFENFAWHGNSQWRSVREENGVAVVETDTSTFSFNFIILATGFAIDLSARAELAPIVEQIALWRHRFTPPPGEDSATLASYPYLGTAFQFMERKPGLAPYLSRLHNFTFAAMASLGVTGAAITGIKFGVPRLISGVVGDLFREDVALYYRDLGAYAVPELETLDTPLPWLKQLAVKAIAADSLLADLGKASGQTLWPPTPRSRPTHARRRGIHPKHASETVK